MNCGPERKTDAEIYADAERRRQARQIDDAYAARMAAKRRPPSAGPVIVEPTPKPRNPLKSEAKA